FAPQGDRVAIVTGGTDGIGYSTAKHLARLGMHVIIGSNDSPASRVAGITVEFLYCDLASMASIWRFVQKFKMKKIPLHVLVNNGNTGNLGHAGWGTWGMWHGEHGEPGACGTRNTGNPGHVGRGTRGTRASYTLSCFKLALVLFTYHLQRLLAAAGSHVTANVVDPGVVDTDLYRHVFWGTRLVKKLLGWLLFKTPDEGARTSVYAAVTPELEGVGGRYLYNEREIRSLPVTYDQKLQQQLWSKSCEMTGILDVTL
uniref:Uncharacterized protein n=1 Tax=Aotus nancymaae TaxID=37293 RepID=A0A2K5DLT4_AOTNA